MEIDISKNTNAVSSYSLYEIGYIKLRVGMAYLAFIFPLIFLISSFILRRTDFQDSISAYYFSRDTERNLFVGILICIGIFLHLYEGYSVLEDRILSLAGVFAIGIALVPMGTIGWEVFGQRVTLHGIFAALFFACIHIVAIWLSETTLSDLEGKRRRFFEKRYKIVSGIMIGSIIIALAAYLLPKTWLLERFNGKLVFWVETVGVWCFAAFWYYKTREVNPHIPWRPIGFRRARVR